MHWQCGPNYRCYWRKSTTSVVKCLLSRKSISYYYDDFYYHHTYSAYKDDYQYLDDHWNLIESMSSHIINHNDVIYSPVTRFLNTLLTANDLINWLLCMIWHSTNFLDILGQIPGVNKFPLANKFHQHGIKLSFIVLFSWLLIKFDMIV